MIAVDSNLLVYAHRRDSPWHREASRCLKELAEGRAAWGIPWPCVHEFLSIVTHAQIYRPPSTLAQAIDQVAGWLASPTLVLLTETADYWEHLRRVLNQARVAGPKIHDARIAALCQAHGARELWTADRDFSRFAGLQAKNPLVA
ncbi:MAG: PIN domain-containing protein [Deltaproteobacteria bacterium]|nr:PIN domain-containing protein [Deltaproteobacteria bacterium]